MLVAAGLSNARDHALISVLALNGLRVSEAIGPDIDDLGLERGHRTLTILRKGDRIVTVPLAPRTARGNSHTRSRVESLVRRMSDGRLPTLDLQDNRSFLGARSGRSARRRLGYKAPAG